VVGARQESPQESKVRIYQYAGLPLTAVGPQSYGRAARRGTGITRRRCGPHTKPHSHPPNEVLRNQRLAAIHALARFIAERSPEHLPWNSGRNNSTVTYVRRASGRRRKKQPSKALMSAIADIATMFSNADILRGSMRIRTPIDLGAVIRDRRMKLGLDQKVCGFEKSTAPRPAGSGESHRP
jgi:hypothetical protein